MKTKHTLINIVAALTLALTPVAAKAECTTPTDGMDMTQDTTFCDGTYNLPNGVNVTAHGVTLDCNGAKLVGNGGNNGIEVRGYDDVTVRNCDVSSYDDGILVIETNGALIEDNYAHNNRDGLLHHNGTFMSSSGIVRRNRVEGNSVLGLFLQKLDNDHVHDNQVIGNGYGIYSWYMDNSVVENNQVVGNGQNVILAGSFGNDFKNNEVDGTRLWLNNESANNNVYANTISGVGIADSLIDVNTFCVGNVGNTYINGATGPECPPCESLWECNGHNECSEGYQACNSAVDANSCGVPYEGDYSEFNPLDCDEDNDGVWNDYDSCSGTNIPEVGVPLNGLKNKRYAVTTDETSNGYAVFSTVVKGPQTPKDYTVGDTAGCSCEQILYNLRTDPESGEYKNGCKESTLEDWVR